MSFYKDTKYIHCEMFVPPQILLHDFTHHNLEMACLFVEHCGRFLLRSPDSHLRARALLVRQPMLYSSLEHVTLCMFYCKVRCRTVFLLSVSVTKHGQLKLYLVISLVPRLFCIFYLLLRACYVSGVIPI